MNVSDITSIHSPITISAEIIKCIGDTTPIKHRPVVLENPKSASQHQRSHWVKILQCLFLTPETAGIPFGASAAGAVLVLGILGPRASVWNTTHKLRNALLLAADQLRG